MCNASLQQLFDPIVSLIPIKRLCVSVLGVSYLVYLSSQYSGFPQRLIFYLKITVQIQTPCNTAPRYYYSYLDHAMRGILEHKQFSSLERSLKECVLFEPESVLVFYGSQTSTEGMITVRNRSGQTLEYSVKSNNKHAYKVKQPKGYLPPGKRMIYFIALKKNNTQQQMVTGDKFRIDVWRTARPFEVYSREYRVALKDDRGNVDGGGLINENGFSTMVQSSGRTGTFASFSKRQQQLNLAMIGIPKPKNKILLKQQKQIEKMNARVKALDQEINQLRDQEGLLQKKYMTILEDKENRLIKWYLILVLLGFLFGIGLRYVGASHKWF